MTVPLAIIAAVGIMAFLSGAASGAFLLLIISVHKAGRGPLSKDRGGHRGAIARVILTRTRTAKDRTDADCGP